MKNKNIKFLDKDLKLMFVWIANRCPGLESVIESDNKVPSKIVKIDDVTTFIKTITIIRNDEIYEVTVYLEEYEIRIKKQFDNFSVIYDGGAGSRIRPKGFLYENQNQVRSIREPNITQEEGLNNISKYEFTEFNKHYYITIKDRENKVENLINNLLYAEGTFKNISTLFQKMIDLFDLKDVDLLITDESDNTVETKNGNVIKYSDKLNINGEYGRLYLKNGNFYMERLVSEEYNDDFTVYVKRLGVINGKEER